MAGPTCVIYNPAAGRGRAGKLLSELQQTLGTEYQLKPSSRPEEAIDLARQAAESGFDRVIAAGGDGTVHEVANGLLRSQRSNVVLGVWPIGSANDFAFSIGMTSWWERRIEALPTVVQLVDVGLVKTAKRERYMIGNFGVGFNGMVTIESRSTHWLKGLPLYGWAFLKALSRHFATPMMSVRFDEREVTTPTLSVSVLNAQREGNFPLCPRARVDDGLLDYLHAKRLSRGHLLRYLPAMARGTLPTNHRLLEVGQARRIAVRSEMPFCVHADGELLCVPKDCVSEVTIEVIPRRLRVELFPEAMYGKWAERRKPTQLG